MYSYYKLSKDERMEIQMLLNKIFEKIEDNGKTFYVGQSIVANNVLLEYEGLSGHIKEIRTGEDKVTENETIDIHVCFEEPNEPERVKKLEEDFSDLYDEPKTIDDIILDEVVMAPEMLESNPNIKQLVDYIANWGGLLLEGLNQNNDSDSLNEARITMERMAILSEIVRLLDKMQPNGNTANNNPLHSDKELIKLWANNDKRREFVDTFKSWGVYAETPELNLTFYQYILPDDSKLIVMEHMQKNYYNCDNPNDWKIGTKTYLQKNKYFMPDSASTYEVCDHLKNLKQTLVEKERKSAI